MIKKTVKQILKKLFWALFRHVLSDKQYARIRYWLELDAPLNLKNPQKFTEKIQYIKLYERIPLRGKIANRTAVREYVADKVGDEHLIPLLGIYENLTEEVWESLPNQFVLKANHGCGMISIVRDKREASYKEIHLETEQWKQFDYARFGREWVYENLPRTIVAEQLLLNSDNTIPEDYKFFCFNGRVELIQIDFDRFGAQKRNLYDRNFKQLHATLLYPNYLGPVQQPDNLARAIEVAESLSTGFSFLRVDLYLLGDNIYFGELTNYPGNGFAKFSPDSVEFRLGSLIELD